MSSIKHGKISAQSDGSDPTQVQPSDWNDDHTDELGNPLEIVGGDSMLLVLDYWSDPVKQVQLGVSAATKAAMATVNITSIPADAVIVRAIAMMKFRELENTNAGANDLDGATVANTSQVIQIANDTPGTYYDGINFADEQFGVAAIGVAGGDVLIGSINLAGAGKVEGNDGYIFRWLLSKADANYLNFNDVQFGLRIWYNIP